MAFEIKPIKGDFGGEVRGVDPGLEVDDETLRELEAAWYRHSILVFRSLAMSPDQHIAFTRRLGKLHIMEPLEYNLEGHPEVLVVSNARTERRPLGLRGAGMGFHTDGEDKAIPNAGSFLYALKIPPEGGDTLFSDLYAAYAALPDDSKRAIAGKRARFSRISLHNVNYPHLPPLTEDQKRDRPDVLHPLVRRHPRSGRTALLHRSVGVRHRRAPARRRRGSRSLPAGVHASPRVRLPAPMARGRRGAMGQPVHAALRDPVRRIEIRSSHVSYDA